MSDKLKVAVLYDVWEEDPPVAEPEPEKPKRRSTKKRRKKKKEKHDREEIFEALQKLGHEPFYQVLDGRMQSLSALPKCGADLVFNLIESQLMSKTPEDSRVDFHEVFDLEEVLTQGFRIVLEEE